MSWHPNILLNIEPSPNSEFSEPHSADSGLTNEGNNNSIEDSESVSAPLEDINSGDIQGENELGFGDRHGDWDKTYMTPFAKNPPDKPVRSTVRYASSTDY